MESASATDDPSGGMGEGVVQAADPLHDRAQVRLFTLADYVADEASRKLYISGAGLEWTEVVARLDSEKAGCFLSFSLVIRVAIPRAIARATHSIEVLACDRAGARLGPDSLIKADMNFDLQRVPDDFTEVSGNLLAQVLDFPIAADTEDVIFLHLLVDDILISRLPVQLSLEQP